MPSKNGIDTTPSLRYLEKVLRQNKEGQSLARCIQYRDKIDQYVLKDFNKKVR
ncbi:hypothetical protein [Heliophilum fasciatum]|uniref:Uncharacterized protein n=1 Tax=Heliophilum fasciatum TaxID=35700 RepID=A0A4R2RCX0_9FIRM|nr:hypothetical protein [Heliophilum fasciatum]MCW2279422.1 hypothetical protein [Heliophilum fasciatum]TCP59979.1 hypothetical protein EDD73_1447 [Heliophilum fasciatum]